MFNRSVRTAYWINWKSLRMQFMNYFMMVFLYPFTFLVISLASGGGLLTWQESVLGYFVSSFISIFVNMHASGISNSNYIGTLEMYKTYKVRPIDVFNGQSFFYLSLFIPFILALFIIGFLTVQAFLPLILLASIVVSFLFCAFFAVWLGGLIKNPNLASPMINMIYMIIVMTTPLYNSRLDQLSGVLRIFYLINPFAHLASLLRASFGYSVMNHWSYSLVYLLVITVLLGILAYKRWRDPYASERVNLW